VNAMTGVEAAGSGSLIIESCVISSRLVRTSIVCTRCLIEVEGHKYRVNLICLPLDGLDIILGMDWLSANRILIDCNEKKVLFPNLEDEDLLMSS